MTLDPTAPAAVALRTGQHIPPDEVASAARAGARKRRMLVYAARVAVFVIVFGGWQLFTSLKIVDPFFFGQPSGIVRTLGNWVQHGTAYGSVWSQIWVTMEEALLGFIFGVAGGIVFGILLGQVRFLADVLGPYIKAVYDIDLPRPRGAVQEIRFEPRFLELHHQIWDSLREEVERAYARTTTATSGGERS